MPSQSTTEGHHVARVNLAHETVKSASLMALFIFMSNLIASSKPIFMQIGRFAIFPIIALAEWINAAIAIKKLVSAKNKNLGKMFDVVFSLLTAAVVTIAVVGAFTFLAAAPLIAPALFIGAIGAGIVYNLVQFFHHLHLWRTSKYENMSAFFSSKAIGYAVNAGVGLAIIAGIVVTMMIPGLPFIVVAAVSIASAAVVGFGVIYGVYKHFRPTVFPESIGDAHNGYSREHPLSDLNGTGFYARYYPDLGSRNYYQHSLESKKSYLIVAGVERMKVLYAQYTQARDNKKSASIYEQKIHAVAHHVALLLVEPTDYKKDTTQEAMKQAIEDRLIRSGNTKDDSLFFIHEIMDFIRVDIGFIRVDVGQAEVLKSMLVPMTTPTPETLGPLAYSSFFSHDGHTQQYCEAVLKFKKTMANAENDHTHSDGDSDEESDDETAANHQGPCASHL